MVSTQGHVFRTSDPAFTSCVTGQKGYDPWRRLMASEAGVVLLCGHRPIRVRAVSDLYNSSWAGCHLDAIGEEVDRARIVVREFRSLVRAGLTVFVNPSTSKRPMEVEFDCPIPAHGKELDLPGAERALVPPEVWWESVDGMTDLAGGPGLLCMDWFVNPATQYCFDKYFVKSTPAWMSRHTLE